MENKNNKIDNIVSPADTIWHVDQIHALEAKWERDRRHAQELIREMPTTHAEAFKRAGEVLAAVLAGEEGITK